MIPSEPKSIPLQPLGDMAEHWCHLGLVAPAAVEFARIVDPEARQESQETQT